MIDISSYTSQRDNIITDLMPDLTPLLDVMFMLIIFLVLTINTAPKVFDVSLPEDKDKVSITAKSSDIIQITIFASQNKWALDEQNFTNFSVFKSNLLQKYQQFPDKKIMIHGDKKVTIDRLMQLLTFMRSKGLDAADIVMKQ